MENPEIKTVYRSRPLSKVLWLIVWCVGGGFLVYFTLELISGDTGDYPVISYLVVIIGLLLLMSVASQMMFHNEVILSEAGIEIKRGGMRVFSPWENVLDFVNGHGTGNSGDNGRGVYFDKPVPVQRRGLSKLFTRGETSYVKLDSNVPIPMTPHTMQLKKDQFLQTDFGQAVNHFKPDFFD